MHVDEAGLKVFLVDSGLLSRAQLSEIAERQKEESFYNAAVKSGVLSEDELRRAVAEVSGVPFITLTPQDISIEALRTIPEPLSRTHSVVAFKLEDTRLFVALLDLKDVSVLDSLRGLEHKVVVHLTDRASIKRALVVYQKHLKEKFGQEISQAVQGNYPVRLVDALLSHATSQHATGIHLEPSEHHMRVRYRIGSSLHDAMTFPRSIAQGVIERIKSLGSVVTPIGGESIRLRFSSMPIAQGEKIVLHLGRELEGRRGFTLESLGFHGQGLEDMHQALKDKSGLIIVGGAAQSGKTTLLYTLLDLLNRPQIALASVERAVEYVLPHVAQVTIDEENGITTAGALRGILKQDVDVVMVSDASDAYSAGLITGAAAHGKLMITGVEARNSLAATLELRAISSESFLLGTVLKVSVVSALVKRLCQYCKEESSLTRAEGRELEQYADFGRVLTALKEELVVPTTQNWKDMKFYKPVGCPRCKDGYSGILGVQEVLPITAPMKELILRNAPIEDLATQAREDIGLTLAEDALFKAAGGLTSLDEVAEITRF